MSMNYNLVDTQLTAMTIEVLLIFSEYPSFYKKDAYFEE